MDSHFTSTQNDLNDILVTTRKITKKGINYQSWMSKISFHLASGTKGS